MQGMDRRFDLAGPLRMHRRLVVRRIQFGPALLSADPMRRL